MSLSHMEWRERERERERERDRNRGEGGRRKGKGENDVLRLVEEIYGGTLSAPQYRPRLVPKCAPGYQF